MKRAAIYVRVSTELQAGQASPVEQERDCRAHAEARGYQVVEVYRDAERYRVGKRLVSPSGTRTDRPAFVKLLGDAEAEAFDLVIAWREDRLYRGLRAMLAILELVEAGKLGIELVKETFDPNMAPIKASIARMELKAFRERSAMGAKARLRAGKPWGAPRYGYRRNGDAVEIEPIEAEWVGWIFEQYVGGVGAREIARRLLAEGAPTRNGATMPWQVSSVYRILSSELYASGLQQAKRDGQTFEIPVPPIIDPRLFERAKAMREANREDQRRNVKHRYLLLGLLTCPCGIKWGAYTRQRQQTWTKRSTGERLQYPARHSYYRCSRIISNVDREATHPNCPRTKGVIRLDQEVWAKVATVLRHPDVLVAAASDRLAELRAQHAEASRQEAALHARLEELQGQRQVYVEKFGRDAATGGPFTEADLDAALGSLTLQEQEIQRELAEVRLLASSELDNLDRFVHEHVGRFQGQLEWIIDREPESEEEAAAQFKVRQEMVRAFVRQVILRRDQPPEIIFTLDLAPLLENRSKGY